MEMKGDDMEINKRNYNIDERKSCKIHGYGYVDALRLKFQSTMPMFQCQAEGKTIHVSHQKIGINTVMVKCEVTLKVMGSKY